MLSIHSISKRLSISKKLTIIYSAILLAILIIFTLITFFLIRSFMIKDSETIISSNADIISNYIQNMPSGNTKKLENINLSQEVYYSVYDEEKNIISTNIASAVPSNGHRQDRKFRNRNGIAKDSFQRLDGAISTSRVLNANGKTYYIYVTKSFEDIGDKIGDIAGILITISILGLIVSLISGSFLAKKLLRPIKNITNIAKEITSHSLSKRIGIDGAKDEISDLAETFNSMIERLEIDFEKQRRFVSDASHELRTPLAVMYGHVNMLSRWGKNDPEQLEKSLATLKSETENMNKLVENLLYLAKSDNAVISINKEKIIVQTLLKEVVDETKLGYGDIAITYSCEEKLKIYADYSKLKQVLRILIDNSIKFSKGLANIEVNVERGENSVLITVEDKGMGIPEDSLNKIFDRFYRVDESRTKATGGTGLGLSIAKQIIECHGGRIYAESKLSEGTRVNILLPR